MHGRMPVVAAVEGRRQLARRPHVGVARQHVRDLVRVFLVYAGERQKDESRYRRGGQGPVRTGAQRGGHAEEKQHDEGSDSGSHGGRE